MKLKAFVISSLLLIIGVHSTVFSQEDNTDVCEVFSVNINSEKETKLGSLTTSVSEGFSLHKAFKIPNTKLYLVAGIYYDDDLISQKTTILDDAIHLKLLVSSQRKFNLENVKYVNPKLIISATETHFLFNDEIYPIDISLFWGKKAFYMTCKQNTRRKE